MSQAFSQVETFLKAHSETNISELLELLRIPSVSADPDHDRDMGVAADYLHRRFLEAGLVSEIFSTPGHPIVYAEWLQKPGAPTVLIYGHYDVQPADPIDQWTSPPFQPQIRNGQIFARGATDDKGQMFTHVKSVTAWLKAVGELPVNVKFLIEGEEEVGSNHLEQFILSNKKRCQCDVAVISDTAQYGPGTPAITYGLRGIIACEIIVHGPSKDLHSGVFGGAIANPVNVLTQILARLQSPDGKVLIPGFYDDVVELTADERAGFAALPFDEAAFLKEVGSPKTAGEASFTTLERRWARPTFDINGIVGGYTGVGPKTIVPKQALAKITCRLVADQDPEKILASLEEFVAQIAPDSVTLEVKRYHGAPAVLCDLNSPYMQAAKNAVEHGFGKAPVMIREGGSIPVVATFKELLGVDTLLLGWGQNTDNLHSPDEHFSVEAFHQGTLASARLWQELSQIQRH